MPDTTPADPNNPPRRFPVTATTRLKVAEAHQLRQAAGSRDLTVSTLLRQLTLDYLRTNP